MKVYAERMCTADAPDGALCLQIGANVDADGNRLPPIETIDFDEGWYSRGVGLQYKIPERYYRDEDLSWTICKERA